MNRRRIFIALAIALPLAIFVAAKTTASWRPVALASFPGNPPQRKLQASESLVAVGNEFTTARLVFRADTGAMFDDDGCYSLLGQGRWAWGSASSSGGAPPNTNQIFLFKCGDTPDNLYYDFPRPLGDDYWIKVGGREPIVRRSPAADNVEIASKDGYCRWQLSSRRLLRSFEIPATVKTDHFALSRGREILFAERYPTIFLLPTRSGREMRRVSFAKFGTRKNPGKTEFSPFGSFLLVQGSKFLPGSSAMQWSVINSRTGKLMWEFDLDKDFTFNFFAFAGEEMVALPFPTRDRWEVRDLKTGQLVRTLSMRPGTLSGAFSPDNATLYSVSGGVLFRQRAR